MNLGSVRPWKSLNWPNRISLMRLVLVAPFVVLVMNQNDPQWSPGARHAALGVFLVMALSDFLDGLLARKLKARTRLGAILDPLADKALVIFAVILLSMPEFEVRGRLRDYRLHNWMVVAAVGKDLWVIVGWLVIYLVTDRWFVQPTVSGKAATTSLCVLVPAVLVAPELDGLLNGAGYYLVWVCEGAVTILCALAVLSYTRLGLGFVAQRQKPLDEEGLAGSDDVQPH